MPVGFSVPAFFFFFFTSALIPLGVVTMILGALVVLCYEKLLSRWARRGFTDLQKLGLMTGALGFFAAFFDLVLESIGRIGASVLEIFFIIYLLWKGRRQSSKPTQTNDLPQGRFHFRDSMVLLLDEGGVCLSRVVIADVLSICPPAPLEGVSGRNSRVWACFIGLSLEMGLDQPC